MKLRLIVPLAAAVAFSCADAAAIANEAVREMPGGARRVELPPGPKSDDIRNTRLPNRWGSSFKSSTYVIDTSDGLRECPLRWITPDCRPYLKGQDRRGRAWVLKTGGRWRLCSRPDTEAKCVDYDGPAPMTLQD